MMCAVATWLGRSCSGGRRTSSNGQADSTNSTTPIASVSWTSVNDTEREASQSRARAGAGAARAAGTAGARSARGCSSITATVYPRIDRSGQRAGAGAFASRGSLEADAAADGDAQVAGPGLDALYFLKSPLV